MTHIEIPVRYSREIVDSGQESHETNLRYGELQWSLPLQETALVLVDCWAYFPLESFVARVGEICETKIKPVLEVCRELGVSVVHAPSPQWAANYPDFHYSAPVEETQTPPAPSKSDAWPPQSLTTEGAFAVARTGVDPMFNAWWEKAYPDNLKISPHVEPAGEDVVVTTGDELHAFCCERRIKHLVYAGFATNICVLERDYGTREMRRRGYNIVLIRDATTAIESSEAVGELWATRAAVFYIELKVGVSVTAAEFVEACRA